MNLFKDSVLFFAVISCFIGCLLQAIFIAVEHKNHFVGAVVLKGFAAIVFCLIGLFASLVYEGSVLSVSEDHYLIQKIISLIVKGLFFGAFGDILLALRFVFVKQGQIFFLLGIAAFLAGHIFYLNSLMFLSNKILISIIIAVFLAVILLIIILKKYKVNLAFKIFGILYIFTVCLMTVFAIVNTINQAFSKFSLIFAIGAVLFLISDVVLIFNTFGNQKKFALRITNLSLYYAGQLFIALSVFFIK